eukprot:scaffold923_cov256-Pinguiococcus_pyrenoidosus.AAC.7
MPVHWIPAGAPEDRSGRRLRVGGSHHAPQHDGEVCCVLIVGGWARRFPEAGHRGIVFSDVTVLRRVKAVKGDQARCFSTEAFVDALQLGSPSEKSAGIDCLTRFRAERPPVFRRQDRHHVELVAGEDSLHLQLLLAEGIHAAGPCGEGLQIARVLPRAPLRTGFPIGRGAQIQSQSPGITKSPGVKAAIVCESNGVLAACVRVDNERVTIGRRGAASAEDNVNGLVKALVVAMPELPILATSPGVKPARRIDRHAVVPATCNADDACRELVESSHALGQPGSLELAAVAQDVPAGCIPGLVFLVLFGRFRRIVRVPRSDGVAPSEAVAVPLCATHHGMLPPRCAASNRGLVRQVARLGRPGIVHVVRCTVA